MRWRRVFLTHAVATRVAATAAGIPKAKSPNRNAATTVAARAAAMAKAAAIAAATVVSRYRNNTVADRVIRVGRAMASASRSHSPRLKARAAIRAVAITAAAGRTALARSTA